MDSHSPTIDEMLVPFFEQQTAEKTGRRLRRVREVERHLREYLETAGHRALDSESLALLNLERSFEPEGAFTRCMRAEELLFTLRTFIEPAWLPDDRVQARVQVSVVDRLVKWLRWHDLLDLKRVVFELSKLSLALHQTKQAQRAEAMFRG